MRLGTCIALELAVAVGAVAGVCVGVGAVAHGWGGEASAAAAEIGHPASSIGRPEPLSPSLPTANVVVSPAARRSMPDAQAGATVFPDSDAQLLAPLAATPLAHVKANRGGSSLSLRLEFASGARAAFKPLQIHPQSDPRRELAAYRIDRLLGIGHVQPAKAAVFTYDEMLAAVEPSTREYMRQRLDTEAIAPGGLVRGVMSWWIPEIADGKIDGMLLDAPEGMERWASDLTIGAKVPPELKPMLAQLSACVVFDFVIDNADRWSGSNTKVSPDHKTLYFMDNTLAFTAFTLGHPSNLHPLHRIQVFPRRLVANLRAMTLESVTAALSQGDDSGLAPLLRPDEVKAILARRDHVVRYIDDLIAQFGENAVLAL